MNDGLDQHNQNIDHRSRLERLHDQIQPLLAAHERARKRLLRRLMVLLKDDENLMNQLSEPAKDLIQTQNNLLNSAATYYFSDLIRDAIQSESNPELKVYFIEMYQLVYGDYDDNALCNYDDEDYDGLDLLCMRAERDSHIP
jgi:hypothetical protein